MYVNKQPCLLFLITCCILFFPQRFYAQSKTDSLLKALSKAKEDTNKVNILNSLAYVYFTNDLEKTKKYNAEALHLAIKLNFINGQALATNNFGIIIQKSGNYDSALVIQLLALDLYKKINNKKGIAKTYSDICLSYWRKSDFTAALNYQLKSLRLYETINDDKGIAYSYNMIGIIYKNLNKNNEALGYYLRSAAIKKRISDQSGLASTYLNIGNVYKTKLVEDSAMYYYTLSLNIHRQNNNKTSQAMVITNLGALKFEFKKYKEALNYYMLALDVNKTVLDSNTLATNFINIGNAYVKLKDQANAQLYIDKGLKTLHNIGDIEGEIQAYKMLAFLYQETNEDKKALSAYIEYKTLEDSIMGLREKDDMAELQTQYEVEKKDLQLAKNKAEMEAREKQDFIKNIIIISVMLLIILLAVIALAFYRKKQVEQKAAMNEELARQKDIRSKVVIEAEEKERIRIAKDLHDGVGQLLSAAKLNLSSLESKLNLKDSNEQVIFKNAMALVDDSVKEVRSVSHNMMPNTLLKLGLASAVKEFITKIQGMPNLKVNLEIVGLDNRMEQEKETVLYRVIQEIVANIIKHARASELTLQLIRHQTELSIMIEDNGVGFDTANINGFSGIGLKNIISRIEFVNGTVHFDSTIGRGTNVIIEIPI